MTAPMKEPLDHLRSMKKPVTKTIWIPGDSELVDELDRAKEDLRRLEFSASRAGGPSEAEVSLAREALAKAEQAVRDTSVKFVFQAMPRKKFDDLVGEHPPTDEDVAQAKKNETEVPTFAETFGPALIARSIIEPVATPEEWERELEQPHWNTAEIMHLFQVALQVNTTRRVVSLGKD